MRNFYRIVISKIFYKSYRFALIFGDETHGLTSAIATITFVQSVTIFTPIVILIKIYKIDFNGFEFLYITFSILIYIYNVYHYKKRYYSNFKEIEELNSEEIKSSKYGLIFFTVYLLVFLTGILIK